MNTQDRPNHKDLVSPEWPVFTPRPRKAPKPLRPDLQALMDQENKTIFFPGGVSTSAPAYFYSTHEIHMTRQALKCEGCNAPLKSGQDKCWYCRTEYHK